MQQYKGEGMSINPMELFNVGSKIGAVNSGAFGPNHVIKQVLALATKKGLIREQVQGQATAANNNAILKEGRAEALRTLPQDVGVIGRDGNLTVQSGADTGLTRGDPVKTQPAQPFSFFGDEDPGGGTPSEFDPSQVLQGILEQIELKRAETNGTQLS